ncbi:MAG: hypothetical protein AAF702_43235 [Chloroflexota bacterium]
MNLPRWFFAIAFLGLLIGTGGYSVYSQVDVEGIVVFQAGTTIDEALASMSEYDVVLIGYDSIPGDSGISLNIFFEGAYDAESINNHYWRRYAKSVREGLDDIARIERNFDTDKLSQWPAQRQGILDEIKRFGENEDGCWDRGDCPFFEVLEFQVRAPVAVLSAIESEAVVDEVGWLGKRGLIADVALDGEVENR